MADNTGEIWFKILDAALTLPGAKVDRIDFLTKTYTEYFNSDILDKILEENPVSSGVSLKIMDKTAKDTIIYHTGIASSISFVTGIPGGLTILAAIPADIAQYYYHLIVAAQKIAYLYGFADLGENENLKSLITLLVGVMADDADADKTIGSIYSEQFTKGAAVLFLDKDMDKIILKIAVTLSLLLTGKTAFSVFRAIPVLGGIVSGGITLFSFKPMCEKLKERLHTGAETILETNHKGPH